VNQKQKAEAKDEKAEATQAAADAQQPADASTEAPAVDIEKMREELERYRDGWLRERAEFQNYKRRIERETRDSYQNATLDVLKGILPIIDDFERAMSNVPPALASDSWAQGVTLIQKKFSQMLNEYHVTPIDPLGEPFDPNRHQALGVDETTEVESGHVSSVLQKGYLAGESVLRPAIVKVAR
jgi:molecular chaperone GrpE